MNADQIREIFREELQTALAAFFASGTPVQTPTLPALPGSFMARLQAAEQCLAKKGGK